jgi:hypothetical protein
MRAERLGTQPLGSFQDLLARFLADVRAVVQGARHGGMRHAQHRCDVFDGGRMGRMAGHGFRDG